MTIVESNYGAELVNDKGKVYCFDATECMINYLENDPSPDMEYAYILAIAYDTPGQLHPVEELNFLISPNLPSPMGADLTAFTTEEQARAAQQEYGGTLFDWKELLAELNTER